MINQGHSLSWFQKNRPEQFKAVSDYLSYQRVIVEGQVKMGKRELCEIEALMRTGKDPDENPVSFQYITSLNRRDTQEQHHELKQKYGIECNIISKKDKGKEVLGKIRDLIKEDHRICIMVDEGDYGTGSEQLLAKLFDEILNLDGIDKDNVQIRYYTATPHEILKSNYAKKCFHYYVKPGSDYRGAEWFLSNDLVIEAEPFFTFDEKKSITISDQGHSIISGWKESTKPFFILRVSTKNEENPTFQQILDDKNLEEMLANHGVRIKKINQNNQFNWGQDKRGGVDHWSDYVHEKIKTIFIIDQTCGRSTQLGFHPLIFAFHDYRSSSTPYNTYAQSSLRVAHYKYTKPKKFGEIFLWNENPNTDIFIYSNINCIKLQSKLISDEEFIYFEPQRPLSSRISTVKNFTATEEMKKNRKIEFVSVPKNILAKSFGKINTNSKQKYRDILNWIKTSSCNAAKKIRKEHKRSYHLFSKRQDLFMRSISANKGTSLANGLLNLDHHTTMAPIFIDKAQSKYQNDFNNLLMKYPGCQNKIALVIISQEEIEARKNHNPNYFTKNNSMYESKILATN
jgi:hypothetical protein